RLLQRFRRLHQSLRIRVLGLEVPHDLGISLLSEPEVIVLPGDAVDGADMRVLRGNRGCGRALLLLCGKQRWGDGDEKNAKALHGGFALRKEGRGWTCIPQLL